MYLLRFIFVDTAFLLCGPDFLNPPKDNNVKQVLHKKNDVIYTQICDRRPWDG